MIMSFYKANNIFLIIVTKKFYLIVFTKNKIIKYNKIVYILYDTILAI